MENALNFAFCVSENYIKYLKVCIRSIVYHHPLKSINIYILTDKISKKNRRPLEKEFSKFKNINIEIIIIDDSMLLTLKTGIWSKHAWYRILLPNYLPNINKVLYLDADTVVCEDLSQLFNMDLTGVSVAGALDRLAFKDSKYMHYGDERSKYICAGVLLINLDVWRENGLTKKIIKWASENDDMLKWPDQDAINHICDDSKLILPLKYGTMNFLFDKNLKLPEYINNEVKECINNPSIIHYAGHGNTPWIKDHSRHLKNDEWIKYNRMLKHPVRRKYETKGIKLLKFIIFRFIFKNNVK